jgi:hypothetical protein
MFVLDDARGGAVKICVNVCVPCLEISFDEQLVLLCISARKN